MLQAVADCECAHPKNGIRRTFSTITLVTTENMAVLSYDIENQDSIGSNASCSSSKDNSVVAFMFRDFPDSPDF